MVSRTYQEILFNYYFFHVDNGRNFKAIMAWWKEMAQHNSKANVNPVYSVLNSFPGKQSDDNQRGYQSKTFYI